MYWTERDCSNPVSLLGATGSRCRGEAGMGAVALVMIPEFIVAGVTRGTGALPARSTVVIVALISVSIVIGMQRRRYERSAYRAAGAFGIAIFLRLSTVVVLSCKDDRLDRRVVDLGNQPSTEIDERLLGEAKCRANDRDGSRANAGKTHDGSGRGGRGMKLLQDRLSPPPSVVEPDQDRHRSADRCRSCRPGRKAPMQAAAWRVHRKRKMPSGVGLSGRPACRHTSPK